MLNAAHVTVPPVPLLPPGWPISTLIAAVTGLISGLLIRWLLNPQGAVQLDRRLFAYAGLLVLAALAGSLVSYLVLPNLRGRSPIAIGALTMLAGGIRLMLDLAFAYMALWPVGILQGDTLPLGAATARMRQGYLTYLILSFLLELPIAAYIPIRFAIGRGTAMLTSDRLIVLSISGAATTLGYVVLAQIYTRRVRACDLGSQPRETLADVFA